MDTVRVALYDIKVSKSEIPQLIQLAKDELTPIFKRSQGFIAYDIVVSADGKQLVSVSRWRSQQAAEQGARNAADFVRDKMSKQLSSVLQVIGERTPMGKAEVETGGRISAPSYPS